MFKYAKIGDRELIEQVEMPEATKEVLREILAQNRMILEANCMTMRLLGRPMMFIGNMDIEQTSGKMNNGQKEST